MFAFFRGLFGTDFMPHLYCLRNDPGVLWLQVVSDLAIAAAYFAIPLVLLDVVRLRRDILFRRVAVLFVLFIAACGITHLLAVWTIWHPMYRLEGVAKALTALFSVITAIVLVRLCPLLLRLPSIAQLEREIAERQRAEEELRAREEGFHLLLESIEDYAVCRLDPAGLVQSWNRGAQRINGYTEAEILGRHFSSFYTPEDIAAGRPEEALRTVNETGKYGVEGWRIRKDGTPFWAHVTVRPMLDPVRGTMGYAKITRDMTESRELEARFQILLEAAPDGFLIVDRAGIIEFINTRGESLFGYAREEVLGRSIELFCPERVREEQARYGEVLFSSSGNVEGGLDRELWGMRKDGSEFPLEFTLSPLETKAGRVFLIAVRDVTERKKTEARFRALMESAPDAMVISNSQGLIELTNRQAERLFGYSRAEMIGEPVEILIPGDLQAGYERDSKRLFKGETGGGMGAGVDLRARRKDGTEVPVEISFSPLEGPNGTSMTAAIRDITERRKSETRFRALLESAPDAMIIVNSEGMIQLINAEAERLFGYSRDELIGQILATLIPEHLREIHEQHRAGYFKDPKPRQMGAGLDLWAQRKNGSLFPVEISLSPLDGPDGVSVTAAIRDTTDRRQAAKLLAEKVSELRHTNEELQQFAHIASHDLQEPLRMVASYMQLLAKRYKGKLDANADEFIAYAVDGTKRMKELIEDLLMYSRTGKSVASPDRFASEEALQVALRNLRNLIDESGAVIDYDELPAITSVHSQVVQLFQNIVGNAIKYQGDKAPVIHISAVTSGSEWIFSVADNGIGIDPKYFERIFVIFQRLHGREEYEGTGIGLAICKRILQQQGGRIWVESEPGFGSTFYFALPKG
jgi:PAS domain S-box-containing protein